ncbi:hypothetical protein [Rufibacter sp. DG15C]|uniref:hypothetical protein n=1 Tax=Rufibacter sp. DG15C TaxID=1379909 RepID=UPI0012FC1CDB|nr:hypothetical protein [Rufibacter sp. DG15C]
MKYIACIALLGFIVSSCEQVTTAATDAASNAARDVVNAEFERHTGIDSVSTKVGSLDTLNVESTIKREARREARKRAEELLR